MSFAVVGYVISDYLNPALSIKVFEKCVHN